MKNLFIMNVNFLVFLKSCFIKLFYLLEYYERRDEMLFLSLGINFVSFYS